MANIIIDKQFVCCLWSDRYTPILNLNHKLFDIYFIFRFGLINLITTYLSVKSPVVWRNTF